MDLNPANAGDVPDASPVAGRSSSVTAVNRPDPLGVATIGVLGNRPPSSSLLASSSARSGELSPADTSQRMLVSSGGGPCDGLVTRERSTGMTRYLLPGDAVLSTSAPGCAVGGRNTDEVYPSRLRMARGASGFFGDALALASTSATRLLAPSPRGCADSYTPHASPRGRGASIRRSLCRSTCAL